MEKTIGISANPSKDSESLSDYSGNFLFMKLHVLMSGWKWKTKILSLKKSYLWILPHQFERYLDLSLWNSIPENQKIVSSIKFEFFVLRFDTIQICCDVFEFIPVQKFENKAFPPYYLPTIYQFVLIIKACDQILYLSILFLYYTNDFYE